MCTSPILVRNRHYIPTSSGYKCYITHNRLPDYVLTSGAPKCVKARELYHLSQTGAIPTMTPIQIMDSLGLPKVFTFRKESYSPERSHIQSKMDSLLHDDTQYIYRPCGKCPECAAVKQSGIYQRLTEMSFTNYLYYFTLTIKPDRMETLTMPFGACPRLRTVPWQVLTNMWKRIRNGNLLSRPFTYIVFSELGHLHGRPHFHGVICLPKYDTDTYETVLNLDKLVHDTLMKEWRVNVNVVPPYKDSKGVYHNPRVNHRNPKWESMFDPSLCKKDYSGKDIGPFDCHRLINGDTSGLARACTFYITKYMSKEQGIYAAIRSMIELNSMYTDDGDPIDSVNYKMFNTFWNMVRPQYRMSLNFGHKYDPTLYPEYITAIRNAARTCPDRMSMPEWLGDIRRRYRVFNPRLKSQIDLEVRLSINTPDQEYVAFYDPISSKPSPLCRYYRDMVSARDSAVFRDRVLAKYGRCVPLSRSMSELMSKHDRDCARRCDSMELGSILPDLTDLLYD